MPVVVPGQIFPVALYDDVNEISLAVVDGVAIPANTRGLIVATIDNAGTARFFRSDGAGKLQVASQPPQPPAGSTEFVLAIDESELEIKAPPDYHETVSDPIGNSVDMFLQSFTTGAGGDPSERGSRVDLLWREGAGPTDHLIERSYISGQSVTITMPDVNKARDGTQLTGDGSTTKIVIRRYRLSNSDQEVDAIVRGYTE